MKFILLGIMVFCCILIACSPGSAGSTGSTGSAPSDDVWSSKELTILRSLWIETLPPPPPDPSNRYADDSAAVELGRELFFDKRFSANGEVSCGTCHKPDRGFQDDLARGRGVGVGGRRTMPIVGTAYSPWLFWDGRKDGQWAQALGPLENPVEHGGDRTMFVRLLARYYSTRFQRLFGLLPDTSSLPLHASPGGDDRARSAWQGMTDEGREWVTRTFVNIGKSIAAFERQLRFAPSRFDRYVAAIIEGKGDGSSAAFSSDEVEGLRLFIGKGNCVTCHNGPLFTDNSFHNTGVPEIPGLPSDDGRATGARQVIGDEFHRRSRYSDDTSNDDELRFLRLNDHQMVRAYKSPTLRGVADRPPYMHAGQFASLADVLRHYNEAPESPAGHSELHPRGFSDQELRQIEAFLRTLDAPIIDVAHATTTMPKKSLRGEH
jgi:cytochrome c peroxidase